MLPEKFPVEIGLARSEAALLWTRVAVSHEQLVSELIARLPEAIVR